MEVLDQLSAVPLFIRDQEEVSPKDGTRQSGLAVLLGDKGLFHRLARISLNVVGIDVDGVPERDVPECDQTGAQRDLELQGAFDRNRLQEPVLGGRRGEKRQASEKAQVGTADRIDGTNAGSIAKDRLKDEP